MSSCGDPITVVIKECVNVSTAMRKYSSFTSQSTVSALLTGSSQFDLDKNFKKNNPLLSSLITLRLMLNKQNDLNDLDSLTLLQPFLLILTTETTSNYIKSLSLDSLVTFINLNIINDKLKNFQLTYKEIISSLVNVNLNDEQQKQKNDDLVLSKTITILDTLIAQKNYTNYLSDSSFYDLLQFVLALSCNKRRNELLRKQAEHTLFSITTKIFEKLKSIEVQGTSRVYINDQSYTAENELPKNVNKQENYDIPLIRSYLNLLLSLITPENQTRHTNSTRILALQLINLAVEISGEQFLLHPQLFSIVSDPIFKCVLFIIENSNKLSILQAALQLFTTLTIRLGHHLQLPIQITLTTIFNVLSQTNSEDENVKSRSPKIKELLVEQISILWTRSPSFFTSLFINYDCDLDRSDLSIDFLKLLTKLSLPESAFTSTETVPPICLEGLISFVDDMYSSLQKIDKSTFLLEKDTIALLKKRERKTAFINCAEAFNEKPKNGIPLLIKKGFIESDTDVNVAKFLFDNNSRLNKKTMGLMLCDPNKKELLENFINLYEFQGLRVDEAIRVLLTKFRLPGESQQIERIVETFSSTYVSQQNYDTVIVDDTTENKNDLSSVQPDSDSVFVLSYSIIMLNTDLHNPQVKEHMSFEDYSSNLKGCNNSKDFPHWYLDRIYCSIRDKEIVMPEEHHGNDKYFDDTWNNLISSASVKTEVQKNGKYTLADYEEIELAHFNRAIFKNVGPQVLSTLFQIFVAASDVHITTRMLSSVEKCAAIASYFNFKSLFNDVLRNLAKVSTLLSETDGLNEEDYKIPLIKIVNDETKEKVPVGTLSVKLGKSWKGKLSTTAFFNVIKKNSTYNMVSPQVWSDIIKIILNLFESLLFNPNVFTEFQQKLHLQKLSLPLPEIQIDKSEEAKGIFSTFASYLKGDEQPTIEEIEFATEALTCIRSSDISGAVFGNEANISFDLIKLFLNSIPEKRTRGNERFYESELLFLVEAAVGLYFVCKNDTEFGNFLLDKLSEIYKIPNLSDEVLHRLMNYKIILLSVLDKKENVIVELLENEFIKKEKLFGKAFFKTSEGSAFTHSLVALIKIENYKTTLFANKNFWKFLRFLSTNYGQASIILEYIESLLGEYYSDVDSSAMINILGIIDEISSLGSASSAWEKSNQGKPEATENPYKAVVDLSKKAINLVSKLVENSKEFQKLRETEKTALIQVLCHQCQNPSKEIREYSLNNLETTLTENFDASAKFDQIEKLINEGITPLLNAENSKTPQILQVIAKIYLYYSKLEKTDNDTYVNILSIFNKFVDNIEVEKILQQLIMDKKEIEKARSGASTPLN